MKKDILKAVLSTATLLAAAGYGMMAQAHCINNATITNNSNAYQMDVYVFECPVTTTTGVSAQVSNQSGAPVSVEVGFGNTHVTSTIDSTAAGAAANSTCNAAGNIAFAGGATGSNTVTKSNGPGVYTVMVSKNSASSSTYDLGIHCTGNLPVTDFPEAPSGSGLDWDTPLNH